MGLLTLTTPLSGVDCHTLLMGLAMNNLSAKSEVSISTGYNDMKGDVENGVVWGN